MNFTRMQHMCSLVSMLGTKHRYLSFLKRHMIYYARYGKNRYHKTTLMQGSYMQRDLGIKTDSLQRQQAHHPTSTRTISNNSNIGTPKGTHGPRFDHQYRRRAKD